MVGLIFALVAAATAGFVYQKRDIIFEWDWAPLHGALVESVPAQLSNAARDLAEAKNPGEACVAKSLGRDDRYLYMAIGCGVFRREDGNLKVQGDEALTAARLKYSGEQVQTLERPMREAYLNSLRRLIPLRVYEKMRYGFPRSEFLDAGVERMKSKNLAVNETSR
ncbi:MAG: hypothetical protein ACXVB9_03715 [Bdellovibrionota bacterium]